MRAKQFKWIKEYFQGIEKDQKKKVTKEGSLKPHFMSLVRILIAERKGHLVEEHGKKTAQGRRISYDARLIRENSLELGFIEAKDDKDDLQKEILAKIKSGYRTQNILFWQPKSIRLIQNSQAVSYHGEDFVDLREENLNRRQDLFGILNLFFSYESPAMGHFNSRKDQFLHYIQEQAAWLGRAIASAQEAPSPDFESAINKLQGIFSSALETQLSENEIMDWVIQHFFMRSVFRRIFQSDFLNTNPIARPLEDLLVATQRSRGLKSIDDLWQVNEAKALYHDLASACQDLSDDAQKQHFLNQMYERFFQNYSRESADRFGVVYTPPEVVRFMLATTDHLLKTELNLEDGLSQEGVKIIDPFVGTGNFLVHLIKGINLRSLENKFPNDLFANEIQLMPYYISHVNLSDTYYSCTGQIADFRNLALADTFDLLEDQQQPNFFAELEENTQTIRRQKKAGITVVIGNPPYNVGQEREDQNNKNKRHTLLDKLIQRDYSKTSSATNKNALSDVYVKAFRWATERLKNQERGIVAFISNNSFIESQAFDGMRQQLLKDFAKVFVVNLRGNRRKGENPVGNIFGIQVGVAISFLVKNPQTPHSEKGLYYQDVCDELNRYERLDWLYEQISGDNFGSPDMSLYQKLETQKEGKIWISEGLQDDWEDLIPLGTKEGKASSEGEGVIFKSYGSGLKTSRDAWAYNLSSRNLERNIKRSIEFFNSELIRYQGASDEEKKDLDNFLAKGHDPTQIKWSLALKNQFQRLAKKQKYKEVFQKENIRQSHYRPFLKKNLYFNHVWNGALYQNLNFYPHPNAEKENFHIALSGVGFRKEFSTIVCNHIVSADIFEKAQCFPFYTYSPLKGTAQEGEVTLTWGGTTYLRRENITDWALENFKKKLADDGRVDKEAIFYYTFAVLNHPDYAARYDRNLRASLARVGIVKTIGQFDKLANLGRALANTLLDYESAKPYFKMPNPRDIPEHLKGKDQFLAYRPGRMKVTLQDKDPAYLRLYFNDYIVYDKIPSWTQDFKIEGRSPLEWFMKNWTRKVDKESGIVDDPAEYQPVGFEKTLPFYAYDLIPRLVQVGVDAGMYQQKIAKIPLDWLENESPVP